MAEASVGRLKAADTKSSASSNVSASVRKEMSKVEIDLVLPQCRLNLNGLIVVVL